MQILKREQSRMRSTEPYYSALIVGGARHNWPLHQSNLVSSVALGICR